MVVILPYCIKAKRCEHNALGYWSGLALCLTKVRSSRARCPATALIVIVALSLMLLHAAMLICLNLEILYSVGINNKASNQTAQVHCNFFLIKMELFFLSFPSISKSYKKNYIEGSGAFDFYYVSRVFCGWDYGITNKKAAKLKSRSIYNELKVILLRNFSLFC